VLCVCVYKGYSLVALNANTVEYNNIAKLFSHTMTDLNAVIVHIQRLQNPVLWQFYSVFVLFVLYSVVNLSLVQISQIVLIENLFAANIFSTVVLTVLVFTHS